MTAWPQVMYTRDTKLEWHTLHLMSGSALGEHLFLQLSRSVEVDLSPHLWQSETFMSFEQLAHEPVNWKNNDYGLVGFKTRVLKKHSQLNRK